MRYSLGYVFFVALWGVILRLTALKLKNIPHELLLFLIVFYTVIFFHIVNIKNIKSTYIKAWTTNKFDLMLSVSLVSISLGGTLCMPLYFQPSISSFAFITITTCYASFNIFLNNKRKRNLLIFMALLLELVLFYAFHVKQFTTTKFMVMVGATLIIGSAGYTYMVISHRLHGANMTVSEFLMLRFWPLLVILGVIVISRGDLYILSWSIMLNTIVLAFMALVFPVYLSQKGIEKAGPTIHGITIGFVPILVYIFENLFLKINDHSMAVFAIGLAVIIAIQKLCVK
jgi:hypothetical protein